jgi:GrpB-like predicted nucleotidyltransferase (UPF0157 family)
VAEEETPWPSWATERVEIVDFDPAWARTAALECVHLQRLLAHLRVGAVEHVGSTAVPGLASKPILDLQAPVADLDVADEVAAVLAEHGWHYVPPLLDHRPYRRFFVKVANGHRTAHLHLLAADGDRWNDQLAFRDALRADPELLRAYARLKAQLAERHRDDREAYTTGKSSFVREVIGRGTYRDGAESGW